jgi:hypothetical protein
VNFFPVFKVPLKVSLNSMPRAPFVCFLHYRDKLIVLPVAFEISSALLATFNIFWKIIDQ